MTSWSVVEAVLPAGVEDRAAGAVVGAHRLNAETQRRTWGHDDFVEPVEHWLGTLRGQEYTERIVLVAVPAASADRRPEDLTADDVAGAAVVELPRTSNPRLAELDVWADPDRLRQGIGTALVDAAERVAARRGRTTVHGMTYHRGEPPEGHPDALAAASGSGRLDGSVPGVAFAAHRGYRPEQAERYSVLDVPLDAAVLARHLDGAAAAAGPGYRLHSWTDRTPDAWLDDVGVLLTRMSTDVPLADLDVEEDPWDAARVRYGEDLAAASGRGYVVTVAEHVPSGRLVALTRIEHPAAQPECAWQEDTLVLREHRGHRLGMLVKAANLRTLAHERPATRRVHTWNAEENGHMLAINVALGFRPAGVYASWQRRS
ncbi:GNAT family N-acetyltransferase [Cellulomonas cellasea]|uniref:N-acetyltransferase domain-containing protein n=1 Tax=Cellulomonas cellasea DSM 20118 TaxID=1408250 RepID=A0A0A0B372_9CELL|nr:GNAT family N-acetyltransferase [Cellulomonas cellasea]KGM01280.1 hypothetical protein Q760_02610 [Cellulomonas cellasea DSM 20118]